jgi:hypothetical protein
LKFCFEIFEFWHAQMTPRGVQLVLGTPQEPAIVDTIVMSNLGYFQLKTAPGAFDLQLAPGRSRSLYLVDNSTAGVLSQVPLEPSRCCHCFMQLEASHGEINAESEVQRAFLLSRKRLSHLSGSPVKLPWLTAMQRPQGPLLQCVAQGTSRSSTLKHCQV